MAPIETKLANGVAVPLPLTDKEEHYNGRYVVRLPKVLHRRLAIEAKKEGVSLNQYTLYKMGR